VTGQSLVHEEARRTPVCRAGRKGPLQLGWPHFWLLAVTLGGMLGVVAMALVYAYLFSPA
jgi:hypothetical protein